MNQLAKKYAKQLLIKVGENPDSAFIMSGFLLVTSTTSQRIDKLSQVRNHNRFQFGHESSVQRTSIPKAVLFQSAQKKFIMHFRKYANENALRAYHIRLSACLFPSTIAPIRTKQWRDTSGSVIFDLISNLQTPLSLVCDNLKAEYSSFVYSAIYYVV